MFAQALRGGFSRKRRSRTASHRLVAESKDAAPALSLPDGAYIVHAAFGLAGVTKRVAIDGRNVSERLMLNAGGLKLVDKLGETQIPPQRLSISIYVPERGNSEAKLVLANAKADETSVPARGLLSHRFDAARHDRKARRAAAMRPTRS